MVQQQAQARGPIAWFAANPVASNLLMFLVIVAGTMSLFTITKKTMPDFAVNTIEVSMAYPGASPADVESGVILQVEKAVEDVDGITRISSTANEGLGSVQLEVSEDYDLNEVLNDVKVRIDGILTFPLDAEPAQVTRSIRRENALRLEVYGDLDPVSHKELAQSIRDELLQLPDVTNVTLSGARPYEISIEIDESTLVKYGLSLDQIAARIRASSLDLPAGTLDTAGGEIQVRTQSMAYDYQDFASIVLLTTTDGTLLTLGDIATIIDGFEDTESYARFDGSPSLSLNVQTGTNQNVLAVTETVREYVAGRQQALPPSVKLAVWNDGSYYLRDRISLMTSNMLQGAVLVFLCLALFLDMRLAAWVVLGIPVSFLGALALMPWFDLTINQLTLFGFIMVLGIVVDDAIVISESVFDSLTRNGYSLESVILGVQRVATPVIFGVLTTVVAFVPLLLVGGFASAFTIAISAVVILCLLVSLAESKLVLPAHLAQLRPLQSRFWLWRVQEHCNAALERFVNRYYLPWNRWCVANRYTTLAGFVALLILSVGIVGGGFVRVVFLPEIPSDTIEARVTMVEGSPEVQLRNTLAKLEQAAQALNGRFEFMDSETGELSTRVVDHFLIVSQNAASGIAALELDKDVARQVDSDALTAFLEDYVGDMPGLKQLVFAGGIQFGGSPISFQLVSDDATQLTAAANELEAKLRTYSGLINIRNEAVNIKDELRLAIKPQAEVMGLTLNDISTQVRSAFYGSQAQRIQRGDDELRVMVRYPEQERVSVGDLEGLYIRTAEGQLTPFPTVAEYSQQPGYARITRVEGERSVALSADVIESEVEPGEVVDDLTGNFLPALFQRYPAVDYRTDGGTSEQESLVQDMIRGMILALVGIYALLAIPLKSYSQPLVIMSVIPFGIIGAIAGHWLLGIPLNFLSLLGIIALSGVVVNDSIVMLDYINQSRAEGTPLLDAVHSAGAARFRAIMLTSITTFFGLVPIVLETSMQAQFLIPMATSLAFGVAFATVITLFLIPCLYMMLEDLKSARQPVAAVRTA